jgi:hypothetical protein
VKGHHKNSFAKTRRISNASGKFAVQLLGGLFVGLLLSIAGSSLMRLILGQKLLGSASDAVLLNLLRETEKSSDSETSVIASSLRSALRKHVQRGDTLHNFSELASFLGQHGVSHDFLCSNRVTLEQLHTELAESTCTLLSLKSLDGSSVSASNVPLRPKAVRVVRLLRVHFKASTLAGERFLVDAARGMSTGSAWSDTNAPLTQRIPIGCDDIVQEVELLVKAKLGLAADWQKQYLERVRNETSREDFFEVQESKTLGVISTCSLVHEVTMNVTCGSFKAQTENFRSAEGVNPADTRATKAILPDFVENMGTGRWIMEMIFGSHVLETSGSQKMSVRQPFRKSIR